MRDDPFPNAPTYDELEEMKVPLSEFDNIGEYSEANKDWYNNAIPVAARLIVQVAREHDEFREHLLEHDDVGSAHAMGQWDQDRHNKLNMLGLSAFQGGSAENLARGILEEDDE